MSAETHDDVIALMPARRGHFLLESGHHGELWLDLELLCLAPDPVRRLAARLAARLAPYAIEAVCGPLVEGAFVAMMVASSSACPSPTRSAFRILSAAACLQSTIACRARCRRKSAAGPWPSGTTSPT